MNTPLGLKFWNTRLFNEVARPARGAGAPQMDGRNTNLFLLISEDRLLEQGLREAAEEAGLLLAHSALSGVVWQLRALRPRAVLLDLDLLSEEAWEVADRLLEVETCPPVILISARSAQFDIGTAVRAGTIVDKSAEPTHLLRLAKEASAQYGPSQAERNSIQRILIRWFRPSGWSVPVTPAYRFWRLKE
jgi:DNA-binding NarL/FixJ family response regulator